MPLYVVATPIGNLEDITLRALRILREVDLVACEDTRRTRKLLAHYQISKPMISYHGHNERDRTPELIEKLENGLNIALVSDAGTPLLSDPGFHLVRVAIDNQIPVVPIPGPSAAITALSASGIAIQEFTFIGFLPSKGSARRARLEALSTNDTTLVFYEAPHRIQETIKDALDILGDRECVLAREITKLHEEFVRARLSEIKATNIRGEVVLLIGPLLKNQDRRPVRNALSSITKEVENLMHADGVDQKTALKRIARERGISKSDAYRQMIAERDRHK